MTIKVKLPAFRTEDTLTEKDYTDLARISEIINGESVDYPENQLNMMYFQGVYTDIDKSMNVLVVFINNTKQIIGGFEADFALRTLRDQSEIPQLRITLGHDYVGNLAPDEALIVQFDLPVKGLDKDHIYFSDEVEAYISVNRTVTRDRPEFFTEVPWSNTDEEE